MIYETGTSIHVLVQTVICHMSLGLLSCAIILRTMILRTIILRTIILRALMSRAFMSRSYLLSAASKYSAANCCSCAGVPEDQPQETTSIDIDSATTPHSLSIPQLTPRSSYSFPTSHTHSPSHQSSLSPRGMRSLDVESGHVAPIPDVGSNAIGAAPTPRAALSAAAGASPQLENSVSSANTQEFAGALEPTSSSPPPPPIDRAVAASTCVPVVAIDDVNAVSTEPVASHAQTPSFSSQSAPSAHRTQLGADSFFPIFLYVYFVCCV